MRILTFLVAASLSISPAFAADVPVASKIDTVTVFPSGAEVSRTVTVKIDAGENTVLINDITGQADLSSVRVEGKGSGDLKIGSVDARLKTLSSTDPAVVQSERKKIEDQIEKLSDQRSELDDTIEVAEKTGEYVQKLQHLPEVQPSANQTAANNDWNALYGTINARLAELAKTKRDAKVKQREINRQIVDLQKKQAEATGASENHTELSIHVKATAPMEATLTVHYQVSSAAWVASYDARLTTGDMSKDAVRKLSIIRNASISQTTGEDWENVNLALSTTRPGTATAAPELVMLHVDFNDRKDESRLSSWSGNLESRLSPGNVQDKRHDASSPMHRALRAEDVAGVGGDVTYAEAKPQILDGSDDGDQENNSAASAFQTIHRIPDKVTIKANGEEKRLEVITEDVEPSLLVRAVPRLDTTAYLYIKFTLPKTSALILSGKVALFRDGMFVGNGQIPQLAPGEGIELGFGADERVKVKRNVTKDKTGTTPSRVVEQRSYVISAKNLHPYPIEMQLLDRVPVSTQQDIKVEFNMVKGPQPNAKDISGRRGTMLWQSTVEPDEEKQFAFGYRVSAPQGRSLKYGDISDEQFKVFMGNRKMQF
jgi:uncharacterized protein (TIGR02231 family)